MIMYAWSPNWKANSVGNDHYNLYVRRSFDGGVTWTTTPASTSDLKYTCFDENDDPIRCDFTGAGTSSFEWYGLGGDATSTEFVYAAGADEQARNVSQLVGNKVTVMIPTIFTDWWNKAG